ncbi:MAG: rhodanese-like domain-containing protein [Desulfococcaceae bacterium]
MTDKDRNIFLRSALCEAKREMRAQEETESALRVCLLPILGTLGLTAGFLFLIDRRTLSSTLLFRGFPESETSRMREFVPDMLERYFSEDVREDGPLWADVRIVPAEKTAGDPVLPRGLCMLLQWSDDTGYSGLAGFSAPLLYDMFTDEDTGFLKDMIRNLLFATARIRSLAECRELEKALARKDQETGEARREAALAREMLDRQLFHLKNLHEVSRELSGIRDTARVLDTFLMMLTGIFSPNHAYIFIADTAEMQVQMAVRGMGRERSAAQAFDSHMQKDTEETVRRLREAASLRHMGNMSADIISSRSLLTAPLCPADAVIGLLFAVDESAIGLAGLGEKITGEAYTQEEQELLAALIRIFMAFAENTRSFETIRRLNENLAQQNADLNRTVGELRLSRNKIEILERTKEGIKSLIRREVERADRVSVRDLILILFMGLALGLFFNLANPAGIRIIPPSWSAPPSASIPLLPAKSRIDKGQVMLVDARPAEFYQQKHIPGAVNIPPALFDFLYMMHFADAAPDHEIIVYGRNISRHYDSTVAAELAKRGHERVFILEGGLDVWEKNGYPTASEKE